jgi:histidinol phosphatase-like PHP family hydrolase
MKTGTGLWIDHSTAFIVSTDDNGEQTKRIESEMEKHIRFSGGAQIDTEEDIRDRRFTNQLNKYYDEVIASIHNTNSVLVFGPGEAKVEFKKRLETKKIKNCLVDIETVDKMTDNQITAKVREHFHE